MCLLTVGGSWIQIIFIYFLKKSNEKAHCYLHQLVDFNVCYLLISPLPEDSHSEDSSDRRSEVTCHRLDVDIQLTTVG